MEKLTEVQLAKPIIAYLEERGWDVYQEVLIYGKVADIVATFGKLTYIIECKTSLSLKLLEQAYNWRGKANFVSIAIPASSSYGDFTRDLLIRNKIGTFSVRYSEVYENIHPQLNRKTINIQKFIRPEHKIWAEAGSQHGYYTPFQRTKQNIEYEIKKHPNGILFKDFIKLTEHHYSTEATARSCLRQWIDSGIIKGAKITYQGNKLFIYPILIDKPK